MNSPDKDKWTEAENKEHKPMVQDGVFQIVNKNDVISCDQKAIISTWTVKKKNNCTYCTYLAAIDFQQQEELFYDIVAIYPQ